MSEKTVQLNIRITESMMARIEAFQALKRYASKRDAVEDLLRAGLAIATEDLYYGQMAKYVDAIVTDRLHSELRVLADRLDGMEDSLLAAAETACAIGVGGIAATVGQGNRNLPDGAYPSSPGAVFESCYRSGREAVARSGGDPAAIRLGKERPHDDWFDEED